MKKLLSLLTLLVVAISTSWAVDATTPDVSTVDWVNNSKTLNDIKAEFSAKGLTLSTDLSLSNNSAVVKESTRMQYFDFNGNSGSSIATKYVGISGAVMDSIAVFWTPASTDACNIGYIGWEDGTTPTTAVDIYGVTSEASGSRSYTGAKWETIDLHDKNISDIRLCRSWRAGTTYEGNSTGNIGNNKTIDILGFKVWLKVQGPSLSVTPATANAFTYIVDNGPSTAQAFTVSLANSEKAVSATLSSTNYEMSKTENGTYSSDAITDLANGDAVYVRLKAGLAKSTGYDGTLTFANDDVTDDVVVSLSGSVTGVAYAISTTTPENGSITASATSAPEGDEITLTATPNFRYALSAWNVYKTGDPTTTVTVTANKFTMPAYAVTVDATFAADPNKQVLYVTADGNVNSSDDLYAALSEDYTVTKAAWNATTVTVTDFDLVVLHESIGGKNVTGLVGAAKTADVPVLNTKSYFYNSGRFDWGTPNAGKTVNGCTQNAAYSNIASHPIFDGVTVTDGAVQVVTTAAAKAMQPVGTIVAGYEGYVLATSPNDASGKGAAIHELTAADRGVASAKYIMISVSNDGLNDLTANGQKLFKNAAAYLLSDEAWTPTLATANITLNAKGYGTYSNANDFTFSGAQAYKMSLDEDAATITGTEVTGKIVAGEGILLKGEAGATVTITGATWATALEGNSLKGTTTANGTKATKPDYCYTLSGDTFKKFAGAAFNDNKAYIEGTKELNSLQIVFEGEGEATAVEAVAEANAEASAPIKVIKNGKLYIGNYNVAGQQVK